MIGHPYFRTRPANSVGRTSAPTSRRTSYSAPASPSEWNHGLGEIITALLRHGMQISALEEHDSIPGGPARQMALGADGEWRLAQRTRARAAELHAAGDQT